MYCTNCGEKLNSGTKYCPNCGTANVGNVVEASPVDLLKGFEPSSELFKTFCNSYENRNSQNGIVSSIPHQTRDFIIKLEFKQCFNLPLDEESLSKLSEKMLKRFIQEAIPKIDLIASDVILAGYTLRFNCTHLNDHTDFGELSEFKTPKEAVDYLLAVDSPDMHTFGGDDIGFKLSPLITGMAGESVLETVQANIAQQYPPAKTLTKAALILLLCLGWHLCRYDMSRVSNR